MIDRYNHIRQSSVRICQSLTPEDSTIQPIVDVSPPKWHLAHTTWFFETFVLKPFDQGYEVYQESFNFLFNSYYEGIGERVPRDQRGNITRPGLAEILAYRHYVDEKMNQFLSRFSNDEAITSVIELGLQHEQQHQELLMTDIKYILSTNPLFPAYDLPMMVQEKKSIPKKSIWIDMPEGIYEIGHQTKGFCFDNELGKHKVFLHQFQVCKHLVTNQEYLEFMEHGGYKDYNLWLTDGWEWINKNKATAPLYWNYIEGQWKEYSYAGLRPIDLNESVCHVNFYEADAFARWKGARLLTEFEWEASAPFIPYGQRWEWTNSAYLPYPFYKKAEGAIGEYNGKFMINQMVLRGGSIASPPGHVRATYRNFFPPEKQWQYSGIRLGRNT